MIEGVSLLDQEAVNMHWGNIAEVLSETPWLGDLYHLEDLYELIQTGQFQVWALHDDSVRVIVVTRIQRFPKKKIFEVIAAKGSQFEKFFDQLEEGFQLIAQSTECDEIAAFVRPGLEKLLKGRGAWRTAIRLSRTVIERRIQ
jgi:hypothetical protein